MELLYFQGEKRGRQNMMEKRAYPRIPSNLYVKILVNGAMFSGIATNISKNGMSLKTTRILPVSARGKILLLLDRVFTIRMTVTRFRTLNNESCELGVEISGAQIDYISLIERIMEENFSGHSQRH